MSPKVDVLGAAGPEQVPGARIVSLVPSLTETVFALGRGDRLVGRTRYCVRPAAAARVAVVGGTKDPDVERVRALRPDLVLAAREENRAEDAALLGRFAEVLVTDVRTVDGALELLALLGERLDATLAARRLLDEASLARKSDLGKVARSRPLRVAYVVWCRPYRVVSADTYIDSLLRGAGFVNPFAGSQERYPEASAEAIREARLDALLLASEPFRFRESHRRAALALALAPVVKLVDGERMCWWGGLTPSGIRYAGEVRGAILAAGGDRG